MENDIAEVLFPAGLENIKTPKLKLPKNRYFVRWRLQRTTRSYSTFTVKDVVRR